MKIQHPKRLLLSTFLFVVIASFAQTNKYIDKANMDLTVKPGDNFYQYADGNWLKNNPIPASKTSWGSFNVLREESVKRLQVLLNDAVKNTALNRKTQMIGDFYASGMDSVAIEKKGFTPIKAVLDRLSAISSVQDIIHENIVLRTTGYGSGLLGVSVGPDRKNVNVYIPSVGQGGTTLPDRDYYLKDDARSIKIREAYKTYMLKIFSLVGQMKHQLLQVPMQF